MTMTVTLFPTNFSRHYSHLMTAASELVASGEIQLRFGILRPEVRRATHMTGVNYLECTWPDGNSNGVCLDMLDWPDIASFDALNLCDLYVKRSYSSSVLSHIPQALRRKIVPYGLYHACSPSSHRAEFKVLWAYVRNAFRTNSEAATRAANQLLRWSARMAIKRQPAFLPIDRLQNISGGCSSVFYHTRLWDPDLHRTHASRSTAALNESRMTLVRVLRKSLGNRFVGGIIPSDYARRACPELLSPHPADGENYLNLLAQSRIVVTEEGLHGSTGSRLGEYFAAGRCIVSEPLVYPIQFAPIDGKHWHTFTSPAECADICVRLLNDPDKVEQTMFEARMYYKHSGSASALLREILGTLAQEYPNQRKVAQLPAGSHLSISERNNREHAV